MKTVLPNPLSGFEPLSRCPGSLIFRCAAPDTVLDIAVATNISRLCRCFNKLVVYTKKGAAHPKYL